jgi:8-amino-3,8-dideoxy-alpha-D-manno-octulosonate transaminase
VIHYQGGAADMDAIMKIAKEKGIYVIEDLAQAFGGEYKGRKLGTIGDLGITSFQINKTITCGEGGLLITSSKKLYARAVRFHDLGMLRSVFQERIGTEEPDDISGEFAGNQYRMSELCGAFILAQFRKLPFIAKKCSTAHKRICDSLIGNVDFQIRDTYKYGDFGTTFFIGFRSKNEASGFMKALLAEGIPVGPSSGCTNMLKKDMITKGRLYNGKQVFIGEETDIHELSAKTDDITGRFVSIGIGPLYSDEDIDDIISAIRKVGSMIYKKG